ncbi:MAG: hypothetical protein LBG60_11385 [Bifidobacteriaceae bacterium]|nr:hypothetical protein [Bifidobacteriaceae bacterium]
MESPVFEIDGVTLAIVDPAGLADAEGSFKTFLGDTHITGGTIALAGSSLPGEYLVNTTEYQDGLLVMMAVDGTVSDFEALAKGAALDQDGSTVRPDVAWASSEFLVLVFGAADQAAEVAFAGTGGTAIKLMAK